MNAKHAEKEIKPDVIVTNPMIGITAMQACVRKGQSDEGILLLANKLNACGTERGWVKIMNRPVQCEDYTDREHIIILC